MSFPAKSRSYFINIFDLFGLPFPLYFKKKESYKSLTGAVVSIISIFIFIALTWYFVMITNFSVLFNWLSTSKPLINWSNTPIFFSYSSVNSQWVTYDEKVYSYEVVLIGSAGENKNNKTETEIRFTNITFEPCEWTKHFQDYQNEIKSFNLSRYMCINKGQNITIHGRQGDLVNGFEMWVIYVNKCNVYDTAQGCQRIDYINERLSNGWFTIYYLSNSIDHYNKTNPIQHNFRNEVMPMSPHVQKNYYYKISQTVYTSDSGWIFEDSKVFHTFVYQNTFVDIDHNRDTLNKYTNKIPFGFFAFTCDEYISNYKRVYTKAQIVIANIGGCINFIYTFGRLLCNYLSKKFLDIEIINTVLLNDCDGKGNWGRKEMWSRKWNLNINKIKEMSKDSKGIRCIATKNLKRNNSSLHAKAFNSTSLVLLKSKTLNNNIWWSGSEIINISKEQNKQGNLNNNWSDNSMSGIGSWSKRKNDYSNNNNSKIVIVNNNCSNNNNSNGTMVKQSIRWSKVKLRKIKYSWYHYISPNCLNYLNKSTYFANICREIVYTFWSIDYLLPYIDRGNNAYKILNEGSKEKGKGFSMFKIPEEFNFDKYLSCLRNEKLFV